MNLTKGLNVTEVSLEDGKYKLQHFRESGTLRALRYDMEWRDLTGDKLIGAMLAELERMHGIMGASVSLGGGLMAYGSIDAIMKMQDYMLIDSQHPVERNDVARSWCKRAQDTDAKLDAIRDYLHPYLDAGTFAAPDWAIDIVSLTTGGKRLSKPTPEPSLLDRVATAHSNLKDWQATMLHGNPVMEQCRAALAEVMELLESKP